jgi:hypothetical protein
MGSNPSALEVRTIKQVALRIVPFLMVCYFVSFVDRVNLGFAALQMVKDLHMSPSVFGLGSGIFFLSYFLCEVPSNLILQKVGARVWIARIMITWGVLAAGMALVTGPRSFYDAPLLGAARLDFSWRHFVSRTGFPQVSRTGCAAHRCDSDIEFRSLISAALWEPNGWLASRQMDVDARRAGVCWTGLPGTVERPPLRESGSRPERGWLLESLGEKVERDQLGNAACGA